MTQLTLSAGAMEPTKRLPDLRTLPGVHWNGTEECATVLCPNPEHNDAHPSCKVYVDHLYCYSCHFARRGLAAVAALLGEELPDPARIWDRVATLRERGECGGDGTGATTRTALDPRLDPLPRVYADIYAGMLWGVRGDRVQWLLDRGLTETTIALEKLGHNIDRFVIPVWAADGRLLTLRYRMDPAYTDAATLHRRKYSGVAGRNQPLLYGEHWLAENDFDWLVVCEGEFDALLLHQWLIHWTPDYDNIEAVSLTNGAGQMHLLPQMLSDLYRRGKPLGRCMRPLGLLFAGDMDEAGDTAWNGRKATKRQAGLPAFAEAADAAGFPTMRVLWPRQFNDLSEYLNAAPSDAEPLLVVREAADRLATEIARERADGRPTREATADAA